MPVNSTTLARPPGHLRSADHLHHRGIGMVRDQFHVWVGAREHAEHFVGEGLPDGIDCAEIKLAVVQRWNYFGPMLTE